MRRTRYLRLKLHRQPAIQRRESVCDSARDSEESAPLQVKSSVVLCCAVRYFCLRNRTEQKRTEHNKTAINQHAAFAPPPPLSSRAPESNRCGGVSAPTRDLTSSPTTLPFPTRPSLKTGERPRPPPPLQHRQTNKQETQDTNKREKMFNDMNAP